MNRLYTILAFSTALMLSTSAFSQIMFSPSTNQGCAPLTVSTTNTSSSGVHFDWYMGDGTIYYDQYDVSSHIYNNPGGYWIQVYAYDAGFAYVGYWEEYVEAVGPPANIDMVASACPGDQVTMYAYMQGWTSISWDFGDGNTASGDYYANHAYSSPGTYYPQVTLQGQCGTFVVQTPIDIVTSTPYFGYNANLWINPTTACPGTNVSFQTNSGFSSYDWDFGDGNNASGNYYVDHAYSSIGSYNVSVTVANGCGVDTVLTDVVTVSNTTPVQNPQQDLPDTICPGSQFYAQAWASDGVSFVWDMGDGSPLVNDQGHEYSYASAGTYYTQVTITNDCGNTITLNDSVVVNNNAPVNNAYLNISQTTACPGDLINFWSNWEYNFYIDFGDGQGTSSDSYHAYSTAGTYPITATIQNTCGNSVTLYDTIYIQNNLPISGGIWVSSWPDPACPGTEIEFSTDYGYQIYTWNFGDGTSANGQDANHIYNAAGTYTATVTVENGCGYTATNTTTVHIQDNLPINQVDYDLPVDTTCIGNTVFIQGDNGEPYSYTWDMGDGTVYTDDWAVAHSWDALGTYYITITVTNTCGNDSTVVDSIVVSDNYQLDPADVQIFVQPTGCVGDELIFVLIPAGLGDITWYFGDGGSTSTVEQVFVQGIAQVDVSYHTYTAPGTYWAKYELINGCGNTVTDSVQMTIGVPGDNVSINTELLIDETQTACQGHPVEFMAIGGGTYIWDFGDGSGQLVTYNSLDPVYHTYANAGSYTVKVTGVNGCGNTDVSDETFVIPPSAIDVSTNTVIESNCGTNNGMAIVSATGGIPPYTYAWTNGDEGVIADSLNSGIYVVTVTDINGCYNEGIATVSDEEGVTILVDNVADVHCYGDDNGSISVTILGGQPPYTILWSNGDQTEDIYGLQAGPYEIFVTDANGCFAVESIEVTQPQESTVSVITQAATCGGHNGTAFATVNNGTGPYNFIWPNATGPSNQTGGLSPGIHTLLIIDGNTCLLQKDFAINEAGAPILVTDSTFLGTCNGDLSDIYISTIGGVQPFTYNWSNGSSNQDLLDVLPGEYEVEVTGNNGCSSYASYTVTESQPDQPLICMVDVDTVTGKNLVVWEDINDPGIASYNIYKESSQAGLYYLIGNQNADSVTQYFDYYSDPSIRSWRYKVSAIDDCGNESDLSDVHKTIHLTSNKGVSGEVNLIWDDYEGFSYPTFYINRWHPSTGWMVIDSLGSNLFSYTDQTPPGDSSLVYMITIETPGLCTPSHKAQDYNSSRSNTDGVNLPDEDPLGVNDNETQSFTIYPNPTNGLVQIAYSGKITDLKLFDVSGQLVYSATNVQEGVVKIDMSSFSRGVYHIQLFTSEGVKIGKVIRE
ncbi:MAG: PKD domain-containing protein [Crocinitomicaceae bacterium]